MNSDGVQSDLAHASPSPAWIVDPERWNGVEAIAGAVGIRQYNPLRFEMEQLTAIVYEDPEQRICVGYKDLGPDEFWVRGQAGDPPMLPPMLMCEASAQLGNYYASKTGFQSVQGALVGLEGVRWHGFARVGQRLYILIKLLKARRGLVTSQFQCAVDGQLLCEGVAIGGGSLAIGDADGSSASS